jgi:hypothetical protein
MLLGCARRNEEEGIELPMTPTEWRRVKKGAVTDQVVALRREV